MSLSSSLTLLKVLLISLAFFAMYGIDSAQAQIPTGLELNGYAWSSNIGWISLNCRTGGVNGEDICNDSNYKVVVNPINRYLNGYAWSPNIGWVKFNGLSGYPNGNGTTASSARLSSTNYLNTTIVGWMRACAGTASITGFCANMNNNTSSGGWDGWISLNGNGYGVNTANFGSSQYVWGSDVVGWVDMSTHVNWYTPNTLTGTGCTINTSGESSCQGRLNWTFTPEVNSPTIVRINPASPTMRLTGRVGNNQSVTLQLGQNLFAGRSGVNGSNLVTHTISAVCGSGLISNGTVCAPGNLTITDLSADPSIVRRGGRALITWQLSAQPVAGQCSLSGPGFNNVDIAGITEYRTPTLNATARITLDCGSVERDLVVTVVPAFNEI